MSGEDLGFTAFVDKAAEPILKPKIFYLQTKLTRTYAYTNKID